jgi:hypothetical protein
MAETLSATPETPPIEQDPTFQKIVTYLQEEPDAALQRVVDNPVGMWDFGHYLNTVDTRRCLVGHLGDYRYALIEGRWGRLIEPGYESHLPRMYDYSDWALELEDRYVTPVIVAALQTAAQQILKARVKSAS